MTGAEPGPMRLTRHRPFVWYLTSEVMGNAGYTLYGIAVVWLALRATGSVAVAGLALGIEFAVYALSFLVGPLVDRARSPRRVAVAGYALQGAIAAGLGLVAAAPTFSVPVFLALVTLLSVVWDFTWTATNAILPRLVHRDDLFRAFGLTGAVSAVPQVLGAVLGAVLLSYAGPAPALDLYAGLNVAALAALLPLGPVATEPATGGFLLEMGRGWRHLLAGPGRPLLQLSVFGLAQGVVSAAPGLLIAVVAGLGYADPAQVYGALATAIAVGAVSGNLLLGLADPRRRLGAFLLACVGVEAALFALAAVVGHLFLPSLVLWFLVGTVEILFFNALLVYLQAVTPPALLGRTFTNCYLFRGAGRATGAVLVGAAAASFAFEPITLALAVGLGLLALGATAGLGRVRSLAF